MLPKDVEALYPLTPMQHLMLLHVLGAEGNGVLLNQVGYGIHGPLDATAFAAAWTDLVHRHGALRTAFLWEGLPQPVQVVRTGVTMPFRSVDLSSQDPDAQRAAIEALWREDRDTPLSLGRPPLMRCTLVRLGDDHHHLLWAVHHLVVDRWSHAVLFDDLRVLYLARVRGTPADLPPAEPFQDYVRWIAAQDAGAAEQFWREELAGVVSPTGLMGATGAPSSGRRVTTTQALPATLTRALRERAAHWRTTQAGVLLAATGLTLAQRAAGDAVLFGATVSGRPSGADAMGATVGSFVSNVPVRVTLPAAQRVEEWVRDVHRAQLRRQEFAHVATAAIHEWSGLAPGRSLFDLLLLLNLTDEVPLQWGDLRLRFDDATLDASYPFVLAIAVIDGQLSCTLIHDADAVSAASILDAFEHAVESIVQASDADTVGDLLPAPGHAPTWPEPRAQATSSRGVVTVTVAGVEDRSVAGQLLRAWQDVLGDDAIGLDDHFLALGGTSLQAAHLMRRVERILGTALPLSVLFASGSVRALLAAVEQPQPRSGPLVRIRSSGTRAPLFILPGIGGSVIGFAGLARELGPDQPVAAFESPGLDGRDAPLTTIEAIAARYAADVLQEPAGPVHLLGVCWGAAVAFEMARVLQQHGRAPASIILMDPALLLRDTSEASGSADATFLRSRLGLYWDELREGSWRERSRMLAGKARRAAQLIAGSETRVQTASELMQFRVREANRVAVTRYLPRPVRQHALLMMTSGGDFGDGPDPRHEWFALIDPVPRAVAIDGRDSGDALSPENVGSFARALREWLHAASHTEPIPAA